MLNEQDREPIATIAYLAANADGQASAEEQAQLKAALGRLGIADLDTLAQRVARGQLRLADVAAKLSGEDARRLAYETALAVCNADGPTNDKEIRFLEQLGGALGLTPAELGSLGQGATALAGAPLSVVSGTPSSESELDQQILRQAMITGAVELLPDRLANVVIIPLQLRLVYKIGQHYGQQLNADQIKDLLGALGIGAAAQAVEGVVRKLVRGVAGGLLGGVIGGAGGLVAGAAVSFASTYALGHVAKQYYAQGRRLSSADLRALFGRFQEEAKTIFPKVQDQIQTQAKSLNLKSLFNDAG
jgi:uncharacterized protein (DUF697 family)/tellurite resistance protein